MLLCVYALSLDSCLVSSSPEGSMILSGLDFSFYRSAKMSDDFVVLASLVLLSVIGVVIRRASLVDIGGNWHLVPTLENFYVSIV